MLAKGGISLLHAPMDPQLYIRMATASWPGGRARVVNE